MGKLTAYGIGALILFGLLGTVFRTDEPTSPTSAAVTEEIAPSKGPIAKQLDLAYRWWTESDVLMHATFTITNKSSYSVKDIEITCKHFAESGTEIDSNTRTIYKLFPAHKAVAVRGFDMGFINSQATKSACSIEDFTIVNEPEQRDKN